MVYIRPMTEQDTSKVIQLVKESFGNEAEFYLDYYPVDTDSSVVIAESEQGIVGVATTYLSKVHPHWLKVMVTVAENFRGQGIGKQLHEAAVKARTLEPTLHGFQGHCYKGEDAAENFMKALGYSYHLTCHVLELDLTQQKPGPRLARKYGHFESVPFTKLLESESMKQHLYNFLLTRYTEEHFWSPPMPKDHPAWQEIIFDDLRPELSFALLDGERIVAASNVLNETPDVLDICWFYSTLEYGQEAALFFQKHLLACMFAEANKVGLMKAALELDSTDRDKQGLLEWLPVSKNKQWQIFQKPAVRGR
jgi:GNAT superfamily N-acetyltransferase